MRADPFRRRKTTAAPATVSGECSFKTTEGDLGKVDEIHNDPRARRPAMRIETNPSGMTGHRRRHMNTNPQATAKTIDRADLSMMPIAFAALAGLVLLFASGYAQASVLHDAAHDQRHAMAFPCH